MSARNDSVPKRMCFIAAGALQFGFRNLGGPQNPTRSHPRARIQLGHLRLSPASEPLPGLDVNCLVRGLATSGRGPELREKNWKG